MMNILRSISRVHWAFAGGIAGIFLLDILLPRGVVEWVFYSIPLFLTIRSRRKNLPFVVAAVCSVLIVVGFFVSRRGGIPPLFSAIDRGMGIAIMAISAILIEHRRRLEVALLRSEETLRSLTRRMESVREEERARLARDVHDDLGQSLTALKMDLRWIERKLAAIGHSPELDIVKARASSAIEVVDSTTAAVQEIATQLRPSVLDRLGLCAAIQFEARRFHDRAGTECKVSLPATPPRLTAESTTVLYRILQECLTNVARHAGATRVLIRLGSHARQVTLSVLDNGTGITTVALESPLSLGLLGMKERATMLGGDIHFHRGRKRGTLVTVRIPTDEP